ncbi:ECF transporter S component [uncultured Tyzzerella sp.]|uniref:ECF transporter S component n=1 Tax=uncultured Tyzzerella sp. TaxID=2321398 RepID=UPI0029429C9B|nr:ECF transporter S component [uncultured Tyzzerella sp.]
MSVKKITLTALISCLAYLVTVFKVPVAFLSYEIKDVIIAIGSIYLGGIYGLIICFVVAIIEMLTVSNTGIIGFLMNFLASALYILPICYIYNKGKGILKGILLGTIFMSLGMFIFNIFITPIYLNVELKETINLLFTLITPFNIIKGALNGFLIFIIYKPLLKAIKKANI